MTSDETIDRDWEGVMLTYEEQDFPGATKYQRTIPAWKCTTCGQVYGSSGRPPMYCGACRSQPKEKP